MPSQSRVQTASLPVRATAAVGSSITAPQPNPPPNAGIGDLPDLHHAVITSPDELDAAMNAWEAKMCTAAPHHSAAVNAVFDARSVVSGQDLCDKVRAMGIPISTNSRAGLPAANGAPPFGTPIGDAIQPAVQVTFRLLPSIEKMTIQLNPRKRTITMKSKRKILDSRERVELLLTFFGKAVDITSSSSKSSPPVAGTSIRDLLANQPRANA